MLDAALQGNELRIARLGNADAERSVPPTIHTAQSVDDRLRGRAADGGWTADVLRSTSSTRPAAIGASASASATSRSPIIALRTDSTTTASRHTRRRMRKALDRVDPLTGVLDLEVPLVVNAEGAAGEDRRAFADFDPPPRHHIEVAPPCYAASGCSPHGVSASRPGTSLHDLHSEQSGDLTLLHLRLGPPPKGPVGPPRPRTASYPFSPPCARSSGADGPWPVRQTAPLAARPSGIGEAWRDLGQMPSFAPCAPG